MTRRLHPVALAAVLLAGCSDAEEPSDDAAAEAGVDAGADAPATDADGRGDASSDAAPDSAPDANDANLDGPDVDPGPVGPCGPIGQPVVYAIHTLRFGVEDPAGVAPGFDVDGFTTRPGDREGCGKPDFTDPEGRAGVDNQFARLIPTLEAAVGESPNDSLDRAIEEAELILLFEIESLDDRTNDECVSVNVYRGTSDVTFGTDGLLLAGQSFDIDDSRPWARIDQAEVRDGRLFASGFRLELPLSFFSTNVDIVMADTWVEFGVQEEDVTGVLGGAMTVADLLLTVLGIDPGFAAIATGLLENNADLMRDESGRCRAISIAWTLGARSGHLYPDTVRPD